MKEIKDRKFLSDELTQRLLSIDRKKIDMLEMTKLFGRNYNMIAKKFNEPIIPKGYKMEILPGQYCGNTDPIITTPGAFMYNLLICKDKCDHLLPNHYYSTWPITAKAHEKLLDIIYQGCITKKMSIEQLQEFLNDMEFWGLKPCTLFSPSFTKGTTTSNPIVQAKKKEMLAKIGDRKPTLNEMVEIEDTLVALSKKVLKDDPGSTLYDSGSRGDWGNDFKINNVLVGSVANPQHGGFDFMESNYIDGIQKKDIPLVGNIVVNAQYPKSVGTQVSGYSTKQFYSVFQSIVINSDPYSDCGSTEYTPMYLDKSNIDDYIFRYVKNSHGGLTEITYDNRDNFINKMVEMRSPCGCRGDVYCAKCAGMKWALMEIENAGASTVRLTNGLLNASMKFFHKTKVTLDDINVEDLLI